VKLPPVGSHVKVQWQDSEHLDGWQSVSTLDAWTDRAVFTYGRIITSNVRGIVVASTVSVHRETDELSGVLNPLFIPCAAIERILVLDTEWPAE
jgi:hypothetical protein